MIRKNLVPNLMVSRNLEQKRFAPLLYLKKKNISNYVYSPRGKEYRRRTVKHSISLFNPKSLSLCEICDSKRERFS